MISEQIGEALWAKYAPRFADLSLKVMLEPEISCYTIGFRAGAMRFGQQTFYICSKQMKATGLAHQVELIYEEIERALKPTIALEDHHP